MISLIIVVTPKMAVRNAATLTSAMELHWVKEAKEGRGKGTLYVTRSTAGA